MQMPILVLFLRARAPVDGMCLVDNSSFCTDASKGFLIDGKILVEFFFLQVYGLSRCTWTPKSEDVSIRAPLLEN